MRSRVSVEVVVLIFVAAQAIWSAVLLTGSIVANDLAALILALVLGLVVVGMVTFTRGPSTAA
jgi:hypothetical protein